MKLSDILKQFMPDRQSISEMVDFFSIFSDETRIRIITLLSISEFCVNDLTILLKLNQSTISHQLRILKDADIVDCYRNGKNIIYYITNKLVNEIMMTGAQAVGGKDAMVSG